MLFLKGLFKEYASLDRLAGHLQVGPKGRTAGEAGLLVEPHRRFLRIACFQNQPRHCSPACFLLEAVQKRLSHAASASVWADEHPLEFCKRLLERDAAASHGLTIQPRDERESRPE